MPWKLIPPREGKTLNWYVRGKYLGIALDDSTGTVDRRAAVRILNTWRQQAERGEFRRQPETLPIGATFLSAAVAYMQAGGERKFIKPILNEWGEKPLSEIDQIAVDTLAARLYPKATPSTRNRQFYTPVSAILKRAGIDKKLRRPQGWRGTARTFWLEPAPTFRLLAAASAVDAEFGIFCNLLNYTGLRLSEALDLECKDVTLSRSFAYVPDTKTGEPRGVFLPEITVAALANHPKGMDRDGRVFRFHNGGWLRDQLKDACKRAKVKLPARTAFHMFRHNYGTWMRLYGGLDSLGLTRTGVWKDMASVKRYSHSVPMAEAERASALPTPKRGPGVEKKTKAS